MEENGTSELSTDGCNNGSVSATHYPLDDAVTSLTPVNNDDATVVVPESTSHADSQVTDEEGEDTKLTLVGNCLKSTWSSLTSARLWIAILSSVGFCLVHGMRCNLGVAIAYNYDTNPRRSHEINNTARDFSWSPSDIGLVDGALYWSYLIMVIPGGYLAYKFPANLTFGGAIAVTSFVNFLLPEACKYHYALALALRLLQGAAEGVAYPSIHSIWRHWAPPLERSRLSTITFSGQFAGVALGVPVSDFLTEHLKWDVCFYVFGTCGLVWCVVWFLWSAETPSKHKKISSDERNFIVNSIYEESCRNEAVPRKCCTTAMACLAVIAASACHSWTDAIMIRSVPSYLRDIFRADEAGALLLPSRVMALSVPVGGWLADILRLKLSTTTVRKIFTCAGLGLQAVMLFAIDYLDLTAIFLCHIAAAILGGFACAGYLVNHLDIANQYASILLGTATFVATLASFGCAFFTQAFTTTKHVSGWSTVLNSALLVNAFGLVFYAIFGAGDKQLWLGRNQRSEPAVRLKLLLVKDETTPHASGDDTVQDRSPKIPQSR